MTLRRHSGRDTTHINLPSGTVSLETVLLPGGMVTATDTTWTPYAWVQDRLGNVRGVVDMAAGTVVERSDYYAFGSRIASDSSAPGAYPSIQANRWRYAGKEEQAAVTGLSLDDFGARMYDPFIARWMTVDPLAEKYPGLSPYVYCADDPVNVIDCQGRDTVLVIDQDTRPKDNGIKGNTYTADVYFIHNGVTSERYRGSSYPDSKSNTNNSTPYNTIKEGTYPYNNLYGHSRGTKKGLNIVDEKGNRVVPAIAPDNPKHPRTDKARDTIARYVNVHSGASDNGNCRSRGSHACVTIHPDDTEAFFSNFNWTNAAKTTGDSKGSIIIIRVNNDDKVFVLDSFGIIAPE